MAALVDTSAWIEFFRRRGREQVKRLVAFALVEGVVVTAAPILVELLVGLNRSRPTEAQAIARLRALEVVGLDWAACERAAALGRTLMRRGRRVPTVDLMIAGAAAAAHHEIWHVGDQHFLITEQIGGPRQRDLAAALK